MRILLGTLAAVAALTTTAGAEVLDATPNGFEVKRTVQIAATPDKVYAALVQPKAWWSSAHSWSGEAANFTLEPRVGGCFCEALPKTRGAVEHMRVVYFDPAGTIRLQGALGPLQQSGADGHLTWTFAAKNGGTELSWTYDVGGYFRGGLAPIAPAVDGVLAEQMGRLKSLVETGKAG